MTTDRNEHQARKLLALGLDEFGHHTEAANVRAGIDLDDYRVDLWAIRAALDSQPAAAPGIDLAYIRSLVGNWRTSKLRDGMGWQEAVSLCADQLEVGLSLIEQADASAKGAHCATCNGHGMVGGLLPAGGYESEPCPDCIPKSGSEALTSAARQIVEGARKKAGGGWWMVSPAEMDELRSALAQASDAEMRP
ncbi:hypothetical protein ACVQEN_06190 [Stenotrophomonas acidaminiphila]